MAWHYTARNSDGRRLSGLLELPERQQVLDELLSRGFTPLSVKRVESKTVALTYERAARLAGELSRLSASGLPLETALSLAAEIEQHGPTKAALDQAARKLGEGATPGAAFEALEGPAGKVLAAAIRAGERSGELSKALKSVAPVLASTAQFKAKFGTLMLYPAAISVTSIGILVVFFLYVLPTLRPVLEQAGEFTGSARLLFAISDALPVMITGLAILLMTGLVLSRFPDVKSFLKRLNDQISLSPMGLGLSKTIETALFARLYGALIASGAPAAEAISEAADALSNTILKTRLNAAADEVREGGTQADALAQALGENDLIARATRIGDKASLSAPLILEAGNVLVDRAAQKLERVAALASPIIIIILGGVIGTIVATVFSTLASLPDTLTQ